MVWGINWRFSWCDLEEEITEALLYGLKALFTTLSDRWKLATLNTEPLKPETPEPLNLQTKNKTLKP